MIAMLADEDFNHRILRGLSRHDPDLNLATVQSVGLAGQSDADVADWAATNSRVLLSHDVNTLIEECLSRVRAGMSMPGVIAVPQRLGIGPAIADLLLIARCCDPDDLDRQIWYLPL